MLIDLSHIKAELEVVREAGSWQLRAHIPELDQVHRPGEVLTTHFTVHHSNINWMGLSSITNTLMLPANEYTGARDAHVRFSNKVKAVNFRDRLTLALYAWNDAAAVEPPPGVKAYLVQDYTRLRMAHFAADFCVAYPELGLGRSTLARLFGRLLRLDNHAPGLVETATDRLTHVDYPQVSAHTSVSGEVCLHWPDPASYLRHRASLTAWHEWTPDNYKRGADENLWSLTDRLVELLRQWDTQTE